MSPVNRVGESCREPGCPRPPYEAGRCRAHFALLGHRESLSGPQGGSEGLNIQPDQLRYAAACLRMDAVDDPRREDLELVALLCERVGERLTKDAA